MLKLSLCGILWRCSISKKKTNFGIHSAYLHGMKSWLAWKVSTLNQNTWMGRACGYHILLQTAKLCLGGSRAALRFRCFGCTIGQNRKNYRINTHLIIHFPMSEGVSKVNKRASEWAQQSARAKQVVRSKRVSAAEHASEASKQVSGASEGANGRASGPVLASLFLFVPDHSAPVGAHSSPTWHAFSRERES